MQNTLKFFAKMIAGEAAIKPEPEDEDEEDEEDEEEEEEEPVHLEPCKPEVLKEAAQLLLNKLPLFTHSTHVEVQERACIAVELAKLYLSCQENGKDIGPEIFALFDEPLLPVSKAAQSKVPVPAGLDLDTPFFEEPPEPEEEDDFGYDDGLFSVQKGDLAALRQMQDDSAFSQSVQTSTRKHRRSDNPFILGGDEDDEPASTNVDDIPVKKLTEDLGQLRIENTHPVGRSSSGQRPLGRRKRRNYKVMMTEERPEGADDDDTETAAPEKHGNKQEDALASISLDMPLRPDEELPVAQHHVVTPTKLSPASSPQAKKTPASPFYLGAPGSPSGAGPQAPAGMEPLCSDFLLQVFYELKTNPKEPLKIMSVLRFQNLSKSEMTARFEVVVPDTPEVCLVHNARIEKPSLALKPGQNGQHQLLFTFSAAPTQTVTVKGAFHYMHNKANEKSPHKDQIAFEIPIPLSLFVSPVSITKEALAGIIKSGSLTAINVQSKVAQSRSSEAPSLIDHVTKEVLHIEPVQGTSGRALFYGKTSSDCHVAMMVRDKVASDGYMQFELKCSGPKTVAESLAAQLRELKL